MLTSFYHRSVLRCGCLAERKSGVADILSAVRRHEKICIHLSRIEYPRQPARANRNLYSLRKNLKTPSFRDLFHALDFEGMAEAAGIIVSVQWEC
jgi:hypothetical protein